MDLQIEYTTGAGNAAIYVRQRNFLGKYGNFSTNLWDTAESANTKTFFTEPDAVNAPGFFSCSFTPIAGGPWPLDIVRASDGQIIGKADTDVPVNSIPAAITADHGPGQYGPGVAADFSIQITAVVAGSDPAIPVPDVTVSLLNEDQSVTLAHKITDSMGRVAFPANNGTYRVRPRTAGYSFDIGEVVVNNADATHTCEGVSLVIPAIDQPGTQTLIISAREMGLSWAAGDKVTIVPAAGQFSGDSVISTKPLRAVIGSDGIAGNWSDDTVPVWIPGVAVDIGLKVHVEVGGYFSSKQFTIDSTPVKTLRGYFP